jgi:PH (Pleckstrin Homology) domain-containing protein
MGDLVRTIPLDEDGRELAPIRRGMPMVLADARRKMVATTARVWDFLAPRPLYEIVAPHEECLVVAHIHWFAAVRLIALAMVSMPTMMVLSFVIGLFANVWWIQVGLWVSMFIHQGFMLWRVLLWRGDRVIVTDRRWLRSYGVFSTTVEDMTLWQLTDRTFHQSLWGRMFDYGTFRFESGGRHDDGATREVVRFVRRPQTVYHAVLRFI